MPGLGGVSSSGHVGPRLLAGAVGRNLLLLAAGMAALYGMIELVFGVAALTFEETGGEDSLAGIAPALFLACAALAALPAGSAMDRSGPRPVLAAGFAAGIVGCLFAAFGTETSSLPPALVGFCLTGVATGAVLLSRAAAAGMVGAERRPRAIALVLFGAVFGALLGPLVFSPMLGGDEAASALPLAWLGGAGFMAAGLLAASRLGSGLQPAADAAAAPDQGQANGHSSVSASLRRIATRPGVPPALLAVLASLAGMVTAMSLAGSALVDHGHEHGAIFPVLAAHFVGMFGFFAVVGRVIERVGRVRAITMGLMLMAASGVMLAASLQSIHLAGLTLFGIGLGWSLSLVAATAELSDRVAADERGTVVGLADLLGNMTGAALVVAGGLALDSIGVTTIAIGSAALPILAAISILVGRRPAAEPAAP
jgi:MFS family permease